MADITVGAVGNRYPCTAGYRCDGANDHTEINAAIDAVAGGGGGTPHLLTDVELRKCTANNCDGTYYLQFLGVENGICEALQRISCSGTYADVGGSGNSITFDDTGGV